MNHSPTMLKRELKTFLSVFDDAIIIPGALDNLPSFLRGSRSETNKTELMMVLHVRRI
ncbi:MAG: hypothetical protein LBQ81_00175 [Zoogloeaceae bacterium]|nr:hypothetical protein [Zoogloeaceae bacterium]